MVEFEVKANWQPREVACRVAMIVGVVPQWNDCEDENGQGPPWLRNGLYQLDEGNNWWLKDLGERRYELHYRYGQVEMLQGLQPFLNWIFK